jgi:hypothetical protein
VQAKKFFFCRNDVQAIDFLRKGSYAPGDWFMQRGQTPMFAREIIYTPYFYLQKRNRVGSINELSSKKRLSLIDRVFVSAYYLK